MKIRKLMTSFMTITLFMSGAFLTTISCGNNSKEEEKEDSKASDYIYQRTFSLAIYDKSETYDGYICGTGWILSDATKDDYSDYEYYLATNWHIKQGSIESFKSLENLGYSYGSSKYLYGIEYYEFEQFSWEDETNFLYDSENPSEAIDFCIAKVKFGNNMSSSIKNKLNTLNNLQKEKKYINKFGSLVSPSSNYANNEMFVGGFPLKGNYTTWRFNKIAAGKMKYQEKNSEWKHNIDTAKTIYDISPLYLYNNSDIPCIWDSSSRKWVPKDSVWGLSGGASGSMLIANIDGEFTTIGIYWGGWYTEEENECWFYPSFSLFHAKDKDFIANYI